jgi:peptide/nickel transport system ATP-binding protein
MHSKTTSRFARYIGQILERPLRFYFDMPAGRRRAVDELLQPVALPPADAERLPSQLSGGEKQRVNLTRALAAEPDILLCDEVTSALDTIVTAHIIELIRTSQERLGISLIFISHDLSTIAACASRVAVLYNGRFVQQGAISRVLTGPHHPYTKLLLGSVRKLDCHWLEVAEERVGAAKSQVIGAEKPRNGKIGCNFFDRCPISIAGACDLKKPPLQPVRSDGDAFVACHRPLYELE